MRRCLQRMALAACVGLQAACAFGPPPVAGGRSADLPLRLSPGSLGAAVQVQQRVTLSASGHTRELDALLEADAQAVRLAVLAFGQTVARLEWDGQALQESTAAGWPAFVTGSALLRDLQLVHWPEGAVRQGLPPGWSLDLEGTDRVLRLDGRPMIRVRYPAADTAELQDLGAGYLLRVETARGRP